MSFHFFLIFHILKFLPICQFADFLTDFPMLDAGLQKGVGIYPGEGWCMPWCPHAKVSRL